MSGAGARNGGPPGAGAGPVAGRRRASHGEDASGAAPEPWDDRYRRFRAAYAAHRAAEGRGAGGDAERLALPYLRSGPQARMWAVRARTFDRFVSAVLAPHARRLGRPVNVLDLGAGNGWLCWRVRRLGHAATAVDLRDDAVDGLGAAAAYRAHLPALFPRVAASFEALPLADRTYDIAVFNASLHYALDLAAALREAARVVVRGGRIAILDSPFYRSDVDGVAMVAEKRREAADRFGERAGDLLALPFIEYLTPARLAEAAAPLGLEWRRRRVLYPFWYEARPWLARWRGRRAPSRFDLWEARNP
ncbi:MAG TPA: class I SAM-dependent methyltransferase [Longimicrobiales bacterium]